MHQASRWISLLFQPHARPFVFAASLRHTVRGDYYCPFHSHRNLEIVYHPTGRGITRTSDRHSAAFAEGSVVLYAPQRAHDQRMSAAGEDLCLQITLPPRLGSRLPSLLHLSSLSSHQVAELEFLTRLRLRREKTEAHIADLRATALLLDLIYSASHASAEAAVSPSRRRVQKARNYIDNHFAKIKSLGEVAQHAGVSHDRLRHLFKTGTGKSLVHYLNETRLAHAKVLLAHSPLPLKQIASICGFKDEYYFSAVFKKYHGQAPGAYRLSQGSSRPLL